MNNNRGLIIVVLVATMMVLCSPAAALVTSHSDNMTTVSEMDSYEGYAETQVRIEEVEFFHAVLEDYCAGAPIVGKECITIKIAEKTEDGLRGHVEHFHTTMCADVKLPGIYDRAGMEGAHIKSLEMTAGSDAAAIKFTEAAYKRFAPLGNLFEIAGCDATVPTIADMAEMDVAFVNEALVGRAASTAWEYAQIWDCNETFVTEYETGIKRVLEVDDALEMKFRVTTHFDMETSQMGTSGHVDMVITNTGDRLAPEMLADRDVAAVQVTTVPCDGANAYFRVSYIATDGDAALSGFERAEAKKALVQQIEEVAHKGPFT